MDRLDLDAIIRKNPHLDRESVEAFVEYLREVAPAGRARYRLAPLGTHRATIGMPDSSAEKTRPTRSYPGF